MQRWLIVLISSVSVTTPAFALPVQVTIDNQLLRDASPWTIDGARIKLGGAGVWQSLRLQPGAANAITLDGAGVQREASVVVELPGSGGGKLVGSIPLAVDGRIRLSGASSSTAPPRALALLQGGAAPAFELGSGAQRTRLAAVESDVDHVWPAKCMQLPMQFHLKDGVCLVDVGRATAMHLELFGLGIWDITYGGIYLATMTSNAEPEAWVQSSKLCARGSSIQSFCPHYSGWLTPIYLNLDLSAVPGAVGSLTGWGLSGVLDYYTGILVAHFPDDNAADAAELVIDEPEIG